MHQPVLEAPGAKLKKPPPGAVVACPNVNPVKVTRLILAEKLDANACYW